jgi:hypothetical protein
MPQGSPGDMPGNQHARFSHDSVIEISACEGVGGTPTIFPADSKSAPGQLVIHKGVHIIHRGRP